MKCPQIFLPLLCVALVVAPVAPVAANLVIGPTQIVAGGGLGEGASALATGLQPTSVLAGTDGDVWIADEQFNRVRRVSADGRIGSVIGTGVYGFNGTGLPALRSHLGIIVDLAMDRQGNLLCVDLANRQIRRLDGDGLLHTFVDATHPLFTMVASTFAPASVAVGPAGAVHIADRGNNIIWQFDAHGLPGQARQGRPVAGNGTRGYSGDGAPSALGQLADPRAVVVGDDGAIWIADTGNGKVRVVSPEGRLWTAATGLKPIDLALDSQGRVFILDARGRQILRLGPLPHFSEGRLKDADVLTTVHRFTADADPVGLDVSADGHMYVADHGGQQVLRLAPEAGSEALVVAGNGSVRASGDGTDARNASLYAPTGLTYDGAGGLWLADCLNDRIRRIGPDGVIESLHGLPLAAPQDVTIDGNGRIFVADTGHDRVLRIGATGDVTVVVGPSATHVTGLRQPTALALDAAGDLLIADSGNHVVRRLRSDGTLDLVAGNGSTTPVGDGGPARASALVRPVDVQVDRHGDLWIADAGAHRVYRVGADGLLRLVAGTGEPGLAPEGSLARQSPLHTPTGIEPDVAGGLVIVDSGNGRLLHVDADGVLRVVAAAGKPQRVAVSPDGGLSYSDALTHRILNMSLQATVRPLAHRLVLADRDWQAQTLAALPQAGLQQVRLDGDSGRPLVTSRGAVTRVGADGQQRQLLGAEADRFRLVTVEARDFGTGLLLVTTSAEDQPKPMTLVRSANGSVERFDLEFLFGGADAMVVDLAGDVLLHQAADGRLLRLRHDRLLNVPGFAQAVGAVGIDAGGIELFAALPAEAAVLAAAPSGGTYVALRGSRSILWVRDLDGDGRARGPLEQRYLTTVPEAPIAMAVTSAGELFVGSEANRLYRVDGGSATLVAHGFGPVLLDLTASADGGLLLLEGDDRSGRLLALTPSRPSVAAWPDVLDFGTGILGETATSTIVLRNDGPLAVQVTPEADDESVDAGPSVRLAPGDVRELEARWLQATPGTVHGEVRWRSQDGQVLARQTTTVHTRAPRLSMEPTINMGIIWAGGGHRVTVPLRNDGDAALRVEAVELVDGPFRAQTQVLAADAVGATLAPGDSTTIAVRITPQHGEFRSAIRVHTNDPVHPSYDVELLARGGAGRIDAAVVDLGAVPVRGRQQRDLVLTNTGDLDVRVGRIASGTRQLIVTPRWIVVPAGDSRTLCLDFLPAAYGAIEGQLTLWTNDPVRPRWTIPFRGRGLSSRIDLAALAHDFGTVAGPVRWPLEVTNLDTRRLRLLEVTTDSGAFRVIERPQHIQAGATATIVVEFQPSAAVATGQLLLRTSLVEAPEIAVALRGRRRVADSIRIAAEADEVVLWPGEDVVLPLDIVAAADLRGVVFRLVLSPGVRLRDFAYAVDDPIWTADQPLIVTDALPDGARVGLSLTGGERTISGSGRLGLLRLTNDQADVLPLGITIRLADGLARGVDGRLEPLAVGPVHVVKLTWRGDINDDGRLDMSDVFALADRLTQPVSAEEMRLLDLNDDGLVDAADVRVLVEHLPGARRPASRLDGAVPATSALLPPFPNPFNAETILLVALADSGPTTVSIYNLIGQTVRVLSSGHLAAGVHRMRWDGGAADGTTARSGVYFAVLQTGDVQHVQRLLLLR